MTVLQVWLSNSATVLHAPTASNVFHCRVARGLPTGSRLSLVGYSFNNAVPATQPRFLELEISFIRNRTSVITAASRNVGMQGSPEYQADTDREHRNTLILPNVDEVSANFPSTDFSISLPDGHIDPTGFTVKVFDATNGSAYTGLLNGILYFRIETPGYHA